MLFPPQQDRRQFLQTLGFSAAALLARGAAPRLFAQSATRNQHLFLFGDWGAINVEPQQHVSATMAAYAKQQNIQPEALFLLGDNFYGQLDGGVHSPRWQTQFEAMYPQTAFPGPCYALLGNHDYNVEPAGKAEAQLAYAAAHPGTRWTMPAKWYRFEYPKVNPLVTFLMLDSNYQKATPEKLSLTTEERTEQAAWLREELAKPRTTPFLIACGHHPLYSNGGDGKELVEEWDGLFRKGGVHAYFCGHIHVLEHLEFAGHPTSFVVSGGGGTTLRKSQEQKSTAQNQFSEGVHGFTHLEINQDRLVIRHLGVNGIQLHAFSKGVDGKVQLI
ncbi:MAG: Metallophosphoesterase [Verrucomicrobiaceae bacterium]|nr:Metallophosphoesterase [Verrucomicrobiaceae bacterium]